MDASRQEELIREMAAELIDSVPGGWKEMNYRYEYIGGVAASENLVTLESGETVRKRHPGSVREKARSLKEGMYQEGKGTWLSMVINIARPGRFKASFNYDGEVGIHPLPADPGSYALELRKFPRDPEYMSDWLREKLRQAQEEQ
ncbi:hypothetical protein [Nocardiopsis algeriensis]|uniref:DUF600 family protein n=1 Tax=Nocardiopsis algeriensis TaxID=1478215 RepID=A0A841ITV0_9ACTN|nr:hypothetical protein [Nocardiopsis algeriensis]MBB6120686.1 hypothetical protein [Nocardiopsis algeriensis]